MTTTVVAAVKEKPILFKGEMVRAILEGRKTMTRRVIKPQPKLAKDGNYDWFDKMGQWKGAVGPNGGQNSMVSDCPYKVGMRLWVRETFAFVSPDENRRPVEECNIEYRADTNDKRPGGWDNAPDDPGALVWKPSIFMPRWASRITLEVTNVRVERLQDISEEDALAEGIYHSQDHISDLFGYEPGKYTNRTALGAFGRLWDSINGKKYPWSSNPWLWCISFRRVEGEKTGPALAKLEGR